MSSIMTETAIYNVTAIIGQATKMGFKVITTEGNYIRFTDSIEGVEVVELSFINDTTVIVSTPLRKGVTCSYVQALHYIDEYNQFIIYTLHNKMQAMRIALGTAIAPDIRQDQMLSVRALRLKVSIQTVFNEGDKISFVELAYPETDSIALMVATFESVKTYVEKMARVLNK